MKAGLWKGKYASVNHHEYFAEGVQSWFDNNRENDHDHNHVNTRAELLEYDPGLAALCREVFGDTELKYTKPATRLTGHLAGYDPAKAPTFVWPERLRKAKERFAAKAQERDDVANGRERAPGSRDGRVHISRELLAAKDGAATARALELLKAMLDEIIRVVPARAVAELQKVPLWVSPEYPGTDLAPSITPMPAGCATTNAIPQWRRAWSSPTCASSRPRRRRMPNFALHELAHAYHDRVLGFDDPAHHRRLRERQSRRQVRQRRAPGLGRPQAPSTAPTR